MFAGKARGVPYNGAPEMLHLGSLQTYPQTLDLAGKACQG